MKPVIYQGYNRGSTSDYWRDKAKEKDYNKEEHQTKNQGEVMPVRKPKTPPINQAEFIAEVAKSQNTSKRAVHSALKLIKQGIADVLKQRKSFRLHEFASFNIVDVKEREMRNPQTGDKSIIPAHDVLRIKPSDNLKNAIKGTQEPEKRAKASKAKTKKKSLNNSH